MVQHSRVDGSHRPIPSRSVMRRHPVMGTENDDLIVTGDSRHIDRRQERPQNGSGFEVGESGWDPFKAGLRNPSGNCSRRNFGAEREIFGINCYRCSI